MYRDTERHPENKTIPGLLIFRLDAPLFFANSPLMRERVKVLVRSTSPRIHAVLLDFEASNDLDVSSADMLAELSADLKSEVVELLLANV
ncbi:MAG: sodium-independent anion transporter, partial [Ktedonobacteraceae bacterium]